MLKAVKDSLVGGRVGIRGFVGQFIKQNICVGFL